MGAPTYKIRNRDASMLLNYGFSLFERKEVIQQDSEISKLQLGNNKDNFIILKAAQPLSLVVEKANELKITTKLDVDKSKKNIKQGDIMGTAIFLIDGKEAGRVEVYSDRDMKNSSVFDKLFSIFKKGDKVEDNSNVEENSSKQEENNK